ncbi:MAG: hypothetical protein FJZ01_06545 [Candidatus Sericytochromatia bacterium]|nr:hypothetical protein [Candidatus Tanganyikabacteria bacterium]
MKRLIVGCAAGVLLLPVGASAEPERPPEERSVEKLPVDLPELRVIGHEVKPDVNLGSKLALEATASVAALPPPAPVRATTELLDRLRLAVPAPPDAMQDVGAPSDREPLTSLRGGLGALPLGHLGSYDASLYHGRRIGDLWSLTDAGVNLHGLDGWSSIRFGQQLAWSEAYRATAGYRREGQTAANAASAVQESGKLGVTLGSDALCLDIQGEVGRVAAAPGDVLAYGLTARADFQPEPLWRDHQVKLGLELGQLGAAGPAGSGWNSQLLGVSAADRFEPIAQVALVGDLGLSLFRQSTYLDPGLRAEFRPGQRVADGDVAASPTEFWAEVRTETRQPGFDELYFSRTRTAGNADLRPQRIAPRVEAGVGHRFSDRAYSTAHVAVSHALDWIHYAPAGNGLWQPRNLAAWQQVYDMGLTSQYIWSDFSLQKFSLRWRNPTGGIERVFSGGTLHESRWLDDKLALVAGMTVDYVELGASQGGGQGLDVRADWEAAYRLDSGMQIIVAGKDWHVWQQEPAAGYFATPAQITAGVGLDF